MDIPSFLSKYHIDGVKYIIEKYRKNAYFLHLYQNEILKYITFDEFNRLINENNIEKNI